MVYADIRGGSQDLCKFSLDFMPARILRIHVPHAFSLQRSVASGVAKCDPQSIWNPRKNCGFFVGILTNKANISV